MPVTSLPQISGGGGGGGASDALVDKSSFVEGTGAAVPIAGIYNETPTGSISEDQAAAARITAARALHVNIRDATGAEIGVVASPVRVDPTGTTNQPIIGTKSSNGGTPGTTNVGVLPAVANTSAPTHTDGRQVALSVDTSGALRVTGISGGGGSVTEYTEDAAAAADPVGAMTMAVRADTPAAVTSTDGDNIALRATNKGEVYVKHVDAIPVTDNGGSLTVDGAVTVSGTATVSGSVSITGTATVAGTVTANAGTNLNTSALALETGGNLAKIPVAQASTTAGQSGPLIQGAVTTAAPTYTTAQTNPLSLTTAGALRVDASATTQPVTESSLVTDNAAFTDGTTKLQGAGFIFDETAGTALTENDMAAGRIDDKRAQVCVIEDTTTRGRRTTVTAANALKVDGSAVTQPVSGSVTSGHGKTILSTGGSASASGNNTILTADGSLKHKVCAFSLTTTSATAMTCIFQSGAGGTELWRCIIQAPSGANAGANLAVSAPAWLFSTAAATLLNLNLSSANAVHYSVSYFTEA